MKKGYILTYSSWENDGDNSKQHREEGLTEKQVRDMLQFLKYCRSENGYGGTQCIGNSDIGSEQVYARLHNKGIALVDNMILNYEGDSEDAAEEIGDEIISLAGNLLGYSEYYTCRVYDDDAKVVYCPVDIEFEDVTKQFKV